jgi:hypothetical protein
MIKPDRDKKNTERRYQHLPVLKISQTGRSLAYEIFLQI